MTSYESLKEKHALTGLYSLDDDNSNVCAELEAYACVLDEVCRYIDELYRECFINTCETYGLSRREFLVFGAGAGSAGLSTQQRRQVLASQLAVTSNDFTPAALDKLLSSFGGDFSVTENPPEQRMVIDAGISQYSQSAIKRFVKSILEFAPAHLDVEVVYSGKRWREIDALNLTFSQTDGKNYTWAQIDALK